MKDLTGYLKRILSRFSLPSFLLFSITLFSFLLFSKPTFAADFQISTNFEHTLDHESINTEVILRIESESPRVISYYTATIPIEGLEVKCQNYKNKQELECTTFNRGSTTDILINLNNSVVRPTLPLEILLTYSTDIVEKSSYTISSEIQDTTTNSVLIRYPASLGEPLWSSEPINNVRTVGANFEVLIDKPTYSNISLLFGEKLLYRFDINKTFSNSLNDENQTIELYVPSDTPTQTIIWEELSPLPDNSLIDEDGNYILKYIVAPNETLDCTISGYIQKTEAQEYNKEIRSFLTNGTGYWSISNDTEFKRINSFLKNMGVEIGVNFTDVLELDEVNKELFYKYIYQYVTDRLNPKEDLSLGIGAETRLGANTIIDTPNNASSIDYADFYITLLRQYNVPSRLVVGYISNITGYTSDGFYHYWVEYFDTNSNTWVTADPFLEEYLEKKLFGSAFLDHIAIVRRGKSAVAPKMSFFQETDFIVRSETEKNIYPELGVDSEFSFEDYKMTDQYVRGYIYIFNTGNIAINGYNILKSNIINLQNYTDPVHNIQSQIVLPKQNNSIQFNIPYEEIETSNPFVNIKYLNLERYYIEQTLETTFNNTVPLYLSIISKIISILIFGIFVFLLYFLIKVFKKKIIKQRKNG